eukprot:gene2710-12580_t
MDWEKKTAHRDRLKGAAGDPFNDILTPGQSLLGTLQGAEDERKDRYGNTVSAKMKAAREKLPSLVPKHTVRSDMTIFKASAPEVHGLLPTVQPAKPDMEGVKTMLQLKTEHHMNVWDTFVGVRDSAEAALGQQVGQKAATLKSRMDRGDAEVEEEMSVLAEDKVMNLTEADVYNVWDAVVQRIPERARWISRLSEELEKTEDDRRDTVEDSLVTLVSGMNDVAHISVGEVERILEKESLALNKSILANRRAYGDLIQRLQVQQDLNPMAGEHMATSSNASKSKRYLWKKADDRPVQEVSLEKSRRQAWEEGLTRWRILRTHHAIKMFNERIRSPEFAEPTERMDMFSEVRDRQGAAFEASVTPIEKALVTHIEKVSGLQPPAMTASKVGTWKTDVARLHHVWNEELEAWSKKLHDHEDCIDALANERLAALAQEVMEYKGYPEEECITLIDTECGTVCKERRDTALTLLDTVRNYLDWQSAEWSYVSGSVGQWMSDLCQLYSEYKSLTGSNEANVRALLKTSRDQFHLDDAAREAALDAAVDADSSERALDDSVKAASARLGSSERALDDSVNAALARLDDIEAGYRSFHSAMTEIAQGFPKTVLRTNEEYHWSLANLLRVRALVDMPESVKAVKEAEEAAVKEAAADEAAQREAEAAAAAPVKPGSASKAKKLTAAQVAAEKAAAKKAAAEAEEAMLKAEQEAAEKVEVEEAAERARPCFVLPDGTTFTVMDDLLNVLLAMGVDMRQEPLLELTEFPAMPMSLEQKGHCVDLPYPEERLREALKSLRIGMLKDMVEFAERTVTTATEWSSNREVSLTEELSAHLRSHRPRAGRIEEDIRLLRSVELVAQRRRVENHMRAQSRAVKAQANQYEEWAMALQQEISSSIEQLRSFETFLGQCLSNKSQQIRKREAEALRLHWAAPAWAALDLQDVPWPVSIGQLRSFETFLGQCLSNKSQQIRKREAEALRARIEPEPPNHKPVISCPSCSSIGQLQSFETFLGQCLSNKSQQIQKREAEALRARIEPEPPHHKPVISCPSRSSIGQHQLGRLWIFKTFLGHSIGQLRSYETFLGQCLSNKSIQIRKREAEALRARIERELTAKSEDLKKAVEKSCAAIIETNNTSELKTFEEGKAYSAGNVTMAFSTSELKTFEEGEAYSAGNVTMAFSTSELKTFEEGEAYSAGNVTMAFSTSELKTFEEGEAYSAGNVTMAFSTSELKTFEEGGAYSAGNVAMYKQSLAAIDTHMEASQATQLERTEELQKQLANEADEALAYVHELLPSHEEDMTLIEKMDALLEAARSKARTELGPLTGRQSGSLTARLSMATGLLTAKPSMAAGQIALQQLSHAQSTRAGPAPAVAVTPRQPPQALARCRDVLNSLDALRRMLHRQCMSMTFLQSTGLTVEPVEISIDAEGEPPPGGSSRPNTGSGSRPTTAQKATPQKTAPPAKPTSPGKGGAKVSKDQAAAAAAAAAALPPPGSIARETEQVIDSCKEGIDTLAQAYYATLYPPEEKGGKKPKSPPKKPSSPKGRAGSAKTGKGAAPPVEDEGPKPCRPIRYPARIPHKLEAIPKARAGSAKKGKGAAPPVEDEGPKPCRPIRYPARIPHKLEAMLQNTDSVLDGLRKKLAEHMSSGLDVLVKLLDNFIMPDDLPPIGPDEDYVYKLPGRKDDKQLHRLALANAEAEAKADPKSKGGAADAGATAAPSRPFGALSWTLPAGNFDLASLGWEDEEGSGLPKIEVEEAPKPVTPPTSKGGKAAPAKGKKGAAGDKVVLAKGKKDAAVDEPKEESFTISGMDTPCHRAGIRAYRACLQQGEETLRLELQRSRGILMGWSKDEALWGKTWAGLLGQVEGL